MKKGILLLTAIVSACSLFAQIPLAEEKVFVTNERRVNSDELEFSPVFYQDGIVFISTRFETVVRNIKDVNAYGKNIMSIYQSWRNEEGFLTEPFVLADELISRVHEGPVTFGATGETIFFTRNGEERAEDGLKKLQIFTAVKQEEVWVNIQKLPFNNPAFNYSHPSISAEGNALYVASDIPGGYGGMDLYVVYKNDSTWTNLINLGEMVNTPGNEIFPYAGADGTLYFASDGHGGMGGLDLFYSTERNETWGKPVSLDFPFNSESDDFGFIVDRDNKNGYFSSDRKGGFGGDDIYSFHIESDGFIAGGDNNRELDGMTVRDEDGNPLEGASVSAIHMNEVALSAGNTEVVRLMPDGNLKDNFILDVNSSTLGDNDLTDKSGKVDELALRPGNYVLKVVKEGYIPQYIVVTPETDLNNLDFTLIRAVDCVPLVGQVLMENRLFPVGGAAVQIVDVDSKEAITVYSDDLGNYEYCLKCNRTYSVYAKKNEMVSPPGFASTKDISCDAKAKINLPLYMTGTPFYAGMTIRLPNIYFNYNDASLRPDAYKDLDEVVGMLTSYPGMKLELGSHTDARGGDAYNQDLSERRSKSVNKYIVGKGIPAGRLQPRGYGEIQIRNRCIDGVVCNEAEHQYNRRTEIKILEMGEVQSTAPIAETQEGEPVQDLAATNDEPDAGKGGQDAIVATKVTNEEITGARDEKSIPGAYAVIAGTFSNPEYALRRANVLKQIGYDETAIVKMQRTGLHAVWVSTFEGKKEALELVRKLAQQQLNAYVLRR